MIVPIVKNFMFEIHDVYRRFNKSQSRTHKEEETLFRGIYSSDLIAMTKKGIWLKQDKKCSDIFYQIKPHIQINHQWNAKESRYDVIATEDSWNNGDCSLVKTNGSEIFTATCSPLWFEIEPV